MAFNTGYVFGFATAVCVVCGLAVSSLSMGLKDRQDANRRRDVQSNILSALGLPEDGNALEGEAIDRLWEERVRSVIVSPDGEQVTDAADITGDGRVDEADVDAARAQVKGTDKAAPLALVYVRQDGTKAASYAIPLYGVGLWGPLSGYLALDPRAEKVTGATFFAPKETPGLGAEIQEPKFKDQFLGKRIVTEKGEPKPIKVVKGQAANLCPDSIDYCVDGVSGATITSRGVDDMITDAIAAYDPYLKRIRGGAR